MYCPYLLQIREHVLNGERLEIPDRQTLPGPVAAKFRGLDQYITLMKWCWSHEPSDRPTFRQIIVELKRIHALAPVPITSHSMGATTG